MLKALQRALEGWSGNPDVSWEILTVESASEALAKLEQIPCQVVLSDIRLAGEDGVELMREIRKNWQQTLVVLMTAYATVENAVEAMKAGAQDYLIKPFKMDELKSRLARLEEVLCLRLENEWLRNELAQSLEFDDLIGKSASIEQVRTMIRKLAGTDSTLLLRGESGTGKDLVARAIHRNSRRASRPFITACCSAIPENLLESDLFGHVKGAFTGATEKRIGRFEMAQGGTLFLDEIGDMTPGTQVKLLRVLQHGEFEKVGSSETQKTDARIIAATNRNLEQAIQSGQFREDLFFRLNVVAIVLPPLREHKEDIPQLVEHLAHKISHRRGVPLRTFSPEVMKLFLEYDWPGNVREIENAVEYALVMGESDPIVIEDLPASIISATSGNESVPHRSKSEFDLDQTERELILNALEQAGGNQTRAARLLGITRRALGYRRAKHGV